MFNKKVWAIMLCWLIIFIPINSSYVMGAMLVESISGDDQINGFRKSTDNTNIALRVGSSSEVDAALVRAYNGDLELQFESCNVVGSYYLCTLRDPLNYDDEFVTYEISYLGDEIISKIYLDEKSPVVNELKITYPEVINEKLYVRDQITGTYNVRDIGVQDSIEHCVGLKEVIVYEQSRGLSGALYTESVSGNGCGAHSNIFSADISSMSEGENKICVIAKDNFNQYDAASAKCVDVIVDKSSATVSSLKFMNVQTGDEKSYFSATPTATKLVVEFDLPNTPLDYVLIDASDISPYLPSSIKLNNNQDCQSDGTKYTCSFDTTVALTDSGLKNVGLIIADVVGHKTELSRSLNLYLDTQRPELVTISSAATNNGTNWLGPIANKITATFIDDFGIALALLKYNGGYQEGDCTGSAQKTCTWTFDIQDSTSTQELEFYVEDLAGNQITPKEELLMDTTPPVIINATIDRPNRPYLMSGDDLTLKVTIKDSESGMSTDSGHVEIYAHLARILGDDQYETVAADDCYPSGDYWVCSWVLFDVNPIFGLNIEFFLSDIAGNSIDSKEQHSTCTQNPACVDYFTVNYFDHNSQLQSTLKEGNNPTSVDGKWNIYDGDDSSVDFWKVQNAVMSPSQVDRQIAAYIDQYPLYYRFDLVKKTSEYSDDDLKILDLNLKNCNDLNGSSDFSSFFYPDPAFLIYNNEFMKPILTFVMQSGDLPEQSSLNFNCEMEITSRVMYGNNNYKIKTGELEQINITIPLYNLNSGEISKNLQDELDAAKDGWLVGGTVGTLIDLLSDMLTYAEYLCGIYHTIVKITGLFSVTKDIFEGCALFPPAKGACKPGAKLSGEISYKGAEWTKKGYMETVAKLCKWVSCTYSNEDPKELTKPKDSSDKDDDSFSFTDAASDNAATANSMKIDPKKSLFWSIMTFCLPGVIAGLKRWQQTECAYIGCLEFQAATSQSITTCENMKGMLQCELITGEFLHAIPFVDSITGSISKIINAMSSAPSAITFIASKVCDTTACADGALGCSICRALEFADVLASVACDLGVGGDNCAPIWSSDNSDTEDVCEGVLGDFSFGGSSEDE